MLDVLEEEVLLDVLEVDVLEVMNYSCCCSTCFVDEVEVEDDDVEVLLVLEEEVLVEEVDDELVLVLEVLKTSCCWKCWMRMCCLWCCLLWRSYLYWMKRC